MDHQMKRIIRTLAPILMGVVFALSVIGFVVLLVKHFPA